MLMRVGIENYKIFENFQIDDLTKINFFVGKNNCGKTSLLEAIFLCLESRPDTVITIFDVIRRFSIHSDVMSYLFHRLENDKMIRFTVLFDNADPRTIAIRLQETRVAHNIKNHSKDTYHKPPVATEKIIEISLEHHGHSEILGTLNIPSYGNEVIASQFHHDSFPVLFISSPLNINLVKSISVVRENRDENILQKYVQMFDPNIEDVEIINDRVYVDVRDMPKKIPINIMGEGFGRFLAIVASMIANQNQYLLIDEIENGLHFENIAKLLKAVIKLTQETEIQLFITTHSYEFLRILNQIVYEYNEHDNVAIFNLAHTKNKGLKAYRFDMNDLQDFLKSEIEFRN